MIILCGGEKGGTGKTTIAVNLAAMLALAGKDVLLIDTDKQGSANFWADVRSEENVMPRVSCVQKFGKSLPRDVLDLAERYEEVILDAGGRDSLELRYCLAVADRVYVPVQATQFDLVTLEQMDRLVEQAQALNPNLEAYVLINRASTNPSVTDSQEAQDVIRECDHLQLLQTIIRERVAFQRSVREGRAVVEVEKADKKAIAEAESLFREVYNAKGTTEEGYQAAEGS